MSNPTTLLSYKERTESLRARVKAIKAKLPKNYINMLIERHPAYNSMRGYYRIGNVLNGKSTDEELTVILEQLAKEEEERNQSKNVA